MITNLCMKVYLSVRLQQYMKHVHKCMVNMGIQHYAVNSMLYLCMIKEKYIEFYNEFISQLCIYAKLLEFCPRVICLFHLLHH